MTVGGLRLAAVRLQIAWPVLVTAVAYLLFVGAQLHAAHGDPEILIQFGRWHVATTHPPAGAPIVPRWGYDGQLYWLQAHDPLLLRPSTIAHLAATSPSYSLQRVAYPALAWLLAGGHDGLLPWTLLLVNLAAVLGLVAAVAVAARARGRSPAWALVVGLCPGLLIATSRDLSDVVATCAMVGGLLAVQARRRWSAAALLGLAVLAREPMLLAVVAVAGDLGWLTLRAIRSRDWSSARATLSAGWPPVVLPAAAYLAWRAWAHSRPLPVGPGIHPSLAGTPILPPFRGLEVAASGALAHLRPGSAFTLAMLATVAAGILIAFALPLRRGPSAPVLTAALYAGLVLPVLVYNDEIELTRYTMPLSLALLVAGLQDRSRWSRLTLGVAAAGSATVVLLPLVGV